MSSIVCDCSVSAAWILQDEGSAAADRVLAAVRDGPILVPSIWPAEMANVLWAAERRGRISRADADAAVATLARLPIRIEPPDGRSLRRWLSAARAAALSAYDASYLELAERTRSHLASLDRGLTEAARAAGIQVLGD